MENFIKEIEQFTNNLAEGKYPSIRSDSDIDKIENIYIKWKQISLLFKSHESFGNLDSLMEKLIDERFSKKPKRKIVSNLMKEFSMTFRKNILINAKIKKDLLSFNFDDTPHENGYFSVKVLEPNIRSFIERKLTTKLGEKEWYKQGIPKEVRTSIEANREKDLNAKRNEEPPLNYADFSGYYKIIEKNWNDIFSPIFKDKEKTRVRFDDLNRLLRIPTMHIKDIDVNEIGHGMFTKKWIESHLK